MHGRDAGGMHASTGVEFSQNSRFGGKGVGTVGARTTMWCSACAEGCTIALGKAESRGLAPSLVAEDPVPIGLGGVCAVMR